MRPPFYYRLAIAFACPLYRLFLAQKKHKLHHYQRQINERFGRAYMPISHHKPNDKPVIWCHAVSLGELNTAYPLLKQLLNAGYRLWLTSTTQTGFARVPVLFANELGDSVYHSFVPVDHQAVLERFLDHSQPVLAMFIETELWANTLFLLKKRQIPSVLANARLTAKSFANYQKFPKLSQTMMANLTAIIAQDSQSFAHFTALGADRKQMFQAHSLKWSSLPVAKVQTLQFDRPVWIMASTHAGEEQLALATHQKLLLQFANALLIIVPRHPERFDEVANLCQSDYANLVCHRRSLGQKIVDNTQIYLADTMGELLLWYGASDVAVVGGSFVDKGGHNPIEPAFCAKPIIMGQFTKNCNELVADLAGVGALVQVDDDGLFFALQTWLSSPKLAKQAGQNAKALVNERAGASNEQFAVIEGVLQQSRIIK